MKDLHGDKIDEFFRNSLNQPKIDFDESHWWEMENKLRKEKKRRAIITTLVAITGIAAMILVVLALLPENVILSKKPNQTVKVEKFKPIDKNDTGNRKDNINLVDKKISRPDLQKITSSNGRKVQSNFNGSSLNQSTPGKTAVAAIIKDQTKKTIAEQPESNQQVSTAKKSSPDSTVKNSPETKVAVQPPPARTDSGRTKTLAKTKSRFKPSIVLSVTASPDVSTVNSFKNGDVGFSGGILFTVTATPKLSVTSGVVLGRKVYNSSFAYYKPNSNYKFPVDPTNVAANCQVIDIPLNANYTVLNKKRNMLQLSAGVSSYLMLKEKYNYDYENPAQRPKSYQVNNQNNHLMGVGNISAIYQRSLNPVTSIGIQPYLKLPLTDIGYGNVRLISTGVAINLNINLTKLSSGKK